MLRCLGRGWCKFPPVDRHIQIEIALEYVFQLDEVIVVLVDEIDADDLVMAMADVGDERRLRRIADRRVRREPAQR